MGHGQQTLAEPARGMVVCHLLKNAHVGFVLCSRNAPARGCKNVFECKHGCRKSSISDQAAKIEIGRDCVPETQIATYFCYANASSVVLHICSGMAALFDDDAAIHRAGTDLRPGTTETEYFVPVVPGTLASIADVTFAYDAD